MTETNEITYELGPIRPPSEAFSLLVRVTRNCSWNRCKFCHIYKGEKFELRPVEEIKRDILTNRKVYDQIVALAQQHGYEDNLKELSAVVVNNAAGLAGLMLSQLVREGAPFIRCAHSGGTFDMRTMVGLHAAPELRASDLNRVFERFVQRDGSFARQHGGVGLGLNLVRAIVELHGGRVWGELPEAGHVEFVAEVPLAPA